jgi:hypothetical protein
MEAAHQFYDQVATQTCTNVSVRRHRDIRQFTDLPDTVAIAVAFWRQFHFASQFRVLPNWLKPNSFGRLAQSLRRGIPNGDFWNKTVVQRVQETAMSRSTTPTIHRILEPWIYITCWREP